MLQKHLFLTFLLTISFVNIENTAHGFGDDEKDPHARPVQLNQTRVLRESWAARMDPDELEKQVALVTIHLGRYVHSDDPFHAAWVDEVNIDVFRDFVSSMPANVRTGLIRGIRYPTLGKIEDENQNKANTMVEILEGSLRG